MKINEISIGTFIVAWRLYAYGIDGEHFNRANYEYFKKALPRVFANKHYAAVYDKKDNLCFAIFDTEEERHEWLENWFEENPEDNDSGTAKFKDLKKFALDDIDFIGGYSLLSGTNGVLFALR